MKLFLLRHGKSRRRQIGIWGRTFDAPLDVRHLSDLDDARTILSALKLTTAFSSPLLRCIKSLSYTLGTSHPFTIIDDFRAFHSGEFEHVTETFLADHFPSYMNMSYSERFMAPKYGEESISQQALRVRRGLKTILSTPTSTNLVVSTHYSVINIIANVVTYNDDITTYCEGRFDVPESGLLSLAIDPDSVLAFLART